MKKATQMLGPEQLAQAMQVLQTGGLLALPTETVYGLAADAQNAAAVAAIYEAKGRPDSKPLSVLVSGMGMVETLCHDIPPAAYRLAAAFWPGPLTMILPSDGKVSALVTKGSHTLGVRCPDHVLTLALISRLARPLAAPSANRSGARSPKTAADVSAGLDGRIDAILDGGTCTLSIESTIVDLCGQTPVILRSGALTPASILAVIEEEGRP